MRGDIGNLLMKCLPQVTKGHLYHLLGVLDYYVMYRHRASQFCEMSLKITDWVTDPLVDGSVIFCEQFVVKGGGGEF